jgi:hypothetical protein
VPQRAGGRRRGQRRGGRRTRRDPVRLRRRSGPRWHAGRAPGPGGPVDRSALADLAAAADRLGVASALALGLFVHRGEQWSGVGVFTLYGAEPDAFGQEDEEFGSILAAYVSVAAAAAERRHGVDRREAALHRGLSTRDVIGQAKGILMERQHLSAGEAFDVLRRASQRLNRRLADVAQHLADTGALPGTAID